MSNPIEKEVNSLRFLRNRQVVLNFYEDDMMIDREGFFFEQLIVTEACIHFIKEGSVHKNIDLSPYESFSAIPDFPRLFLLNKKGSKVELYFP